MSEVEILAKLKGAYPDVEFEMMGSGCHFTIRAIGQIFENKSLLERHRLLNAELNEFIARGEIHAVQYKIYTPAQWAQVKNKEQNRG